MNKLELKKEFSKCVKKIKEEVDGGEYPKAIMTCRQMELNTANINCTSSKILQDEVMKSKALKEFIEKWGVTATKETRNGGEWERPTYMIRIRY